MKFRFAMIVLAVVGLIIALAGRSIGQYLIDIKETSLLDQPGQFIGDILMMISNSILTVYGLAAVAIIVYVIYHLHNQGNFY